jgi:hypothetical protein
VHRVWVGGARDLARGVGLADSQDLGVDEQLRGIVGGERVAEHRPGLVFSVQGLGFRVLW